MSIIAACSRVTHDLKDVKLNHRRSLAHTTNPLLVAQQLVPSALKMAALSTDPVPTRLLRKIYYVSLSDLAHKEVVEGFLECAGSGAE